MASSGQCSGVTRAGTAIVLLTWLLWSFHNTCLPFSGKPCVMRPLPGFGKPSAEPSSCTAEDASSGATPTANSVVFLYDDSVEALLHVEQFNGQRYMLMEQVWLARELGRQLVEPFVHVMPRDNAFFEREHPQNPEDARGIIGVASMPMSAFFDEALLTEYLQSGGGGLVPYSQLAGGARPPRLSRAEVLKRGVVYDHAVEGQAEWRAHEPQPTTHAVVNIGTLYLFELAPGLGCRTVPCPYLFRGSKFMFARQVCLPAHRSGRSVHRLFAAQGDDDSESIAILDYKWWAPSSTRYAWWPDREVPFHQLFSSVQLLPHLHQVADQIVRTRLTTRFAAVHWRRGDFTHTEVFQVLATPKTMGDFVVQVVESHNLMNPDKKIESIYLSTNSGTPHDVNMFRRAVASIGQLVVLEEPASHHWTESTDFSLVSQLVCVSAELFIASPYSYRSTSHFSQAVIDERAVQDKPADSTVYCCNNDAATSPTTRATHRFMTDFIIYLSFVSAFQIVVALLLCVGCVRCVMARWARTDTASSRHVD